MTLFCRIRRRAAQRRGQAGETIVEVLVALTVACMAMVMLVMAIASSTSIVQQGKRASDSYYGSNNRLVAVASGDSAEVEVTPHFNEAGVADPDPASVQVTYDRESLPDGGSAVAYQAKADSLAEG